MKNTAIYKKSQKPPHSKHYYDLIPVSMQGTDIQKGGVRGVRGKGTGVCCTNIKHLVLTHSHNSMLWQVSS